jgi:hypothetical protein
VIAWREVFQILGRLIPITRAKHFVTDLKPTSVVDHEEAVVRLVAPDVGGSIPRLPKVEAAR